MTACELTRLARWKSAEDERHTEESLSSSVSSATSGYDVRLRTVADLPDVEFTSWLEAWEGTAADGSARGLAEEKAAADDARPSPPPPQSEQEEGSANEMRCHKATQLERREQRMHLAEHSDQEPASLRAARIEKAIVAAAATANSSTGAAATVSRHCGAVLSAGHTQEADAHRSAAAEDAHKRISSLSRRIAPNYGDHALGRHSTSLTDKVCLSAFREKNDSMDTELVSARRRHRRVYGSDVAARLSGSPRSTPPRAGSQSSRAKPTDAFRTAMQAAQVSSAVALDQLPRATSGGGGAWRRSGSRPRASSSSIEDFRLKESTTIPCRRRSLIEAKVDSLLRRSMPARPSTLTAPSASSVVLAIDRAHAAARVFEERPGVTVIDVRSCREAPGLVSVVGAWHVPMPQLCPSCAYAVDCAGDNWNSAEKANGRARLRDVASCCLQHTRYQLPSDPNTPILIVSDGSCSQTDKRRQNDKRPSPLAAALLECQNAAEVLAQCFGFTQLIVGGHWRAVRQAVEGVLLSRALDEAAPENSLAKSNLQEQRQGASSPSQLIAAQHAPSFLKPFRAASGGASSPHVAPTFAQPLSQVDDTKLEPRRPHPFSGSPPRCQANTLHPLRTHSGEQSGVDEIPRNEEALVARLSDSVMSAVSAALSSRLSSYESLGEDQEQSFKRPRPCQPRRKSSSYTLESAVSTATASTGRRRSSPTNFLIHPQIDAQLVNVLAGKLSNASRRQNNEKRP
eukprot:GHVT01065905.1.p1 GENE.GHVT01065905.1~~GHVT01065905.1.p1  ORF type:complete len:741 (+),score=148.96 GHVT01065905.1:291-2513(+)